ncbi:MAG: minor capsid protein [Liquorilactobacillus nagelii]|uniref:minor capsid protein n=1 Tax=Oenococcus sicerae TaxID=2203724 RepID=UPI0039E73744
MADNTLDLQEQLVKSIRAGTGIQIKVDYMAPDNAVGLVPEPGSVKIDEDYAGAEEWQYNYAITVENTSQQVVKQQLFTISQYLQSLTDLQSANGTFEFEEINVSSAPAMTLKDTSGNVQYLLDIAVLVWTNIN